MIARLALAALLATLLIVPGSAAGQSVNEVVIGVISSRQPTAPASTASAAATIAERDLNDYFAQIGDPTRVRVEIRETDQDPVRSTAALLEFIARGIRVVVGPETSNELQTIRPLAAAAGVVLVSYASTAPSLAMPGDAVFRLAPDDRLQAQAISRFIVEDGVQVVVPVWRGDVYGNDLVQAFRADFPGTVAEGVRYPIEGADYQATALALGRQVQAAVDAGGRDAVGVYLVSLGEVTAMLQAATAVPVLHSVSWYGSDGAVLDLGLLADPAASTFAFETGFIAPVFGEAIESDQTDLVAEEIRARTEMAPETYSLTAYDSVMIAGLAAARAGGTADLGRYVPAFTVVADGYFGVTGPVDLNAAGDRAAGSYDFWAIDAFDGSLVWLQQATYEFAPGQPGRIDRLEQRRKPGRGLPLPSVPGR